MADVIVGIILAAAVGAAAVSVIREKRRGRKCAGCPAAGKCGKEKPEEMSDSGGNEG